MPWNQARHHSSRPTCKSIDCPLPCCNIKVLRIARRLSLQALEPVAGPSWTWLSQGIRRSGYAALTPNWHAGGKELSLGQGGQSWRPRRAVTTWYLVCVCACVRNSLNCWLQPRPMGCRGKGEGGGSRPYARRSKNPVQGDGKKYAKKKGLPRFPGGKVHAASSELKPVVRRSLFLVFCACWESSRSQGTSECN